MTEIKTILVPVDFSACSKNAMNTAIDLAKALGGKIHLTHVVHYPVASWAYNPALIPSEVWSGIRDAVARKLYKAEETVAASGVSAQSKLAEEGENAHAIVEVADKIGADLIVMGTHGYSGLKHLMLGSVAERTVRLASCPVMTIRDTSEE